MDEIPSLMCSPHLGLTARQHLGRSVHDILEEYCWEIKQLANIPHLVKYPWCPCWLALAKVSHEIVPSLASLYERLIV